MKRAYGPAATEQFFKNQLMTNSENNFQEKPSSPLLKFGEAEYD
jgi:hypothetical protein